MNPWAEQTGWYLLSQSGSLVVVFGVVWLLAKVLRDTSAHWRYLLWLVVLIKCLTPPVVRLPVADLAGSISPVAVERIQTSAAALVPGFEVPSQGAEPGVGAAAFSLSAWPQILLLVWIAGVVCFLAVVVFRALRIQRDLRRHRTEPDMELECEFVQLAQMSGLKSRPRLCLIVGISQPFVWGLTRGCIYLPMDFSTQGTAAQRRLVLAHELAHVVRWDALVNAVQILVQAMFWFHPLVWWLNRELRHEREKCCDEMAVALLEVDSRVYGSALVERVAGYYQRACPSSSLAISGKAKDLEDRLRALTVPGRRFHSRPTWAALVGALALGGVLVPAGIAVSRSVPELIDPGTRHMVLSWSSDQDRRVESGLEFEGLGTEPRTLAGVVFEPHAAISLNGSQLAFNDGLQERGGGIHLLHGVRGTTAEGNEIAAVRWRYKRHADVVVPIRYGVHARDCLFWSFEPVSDENSAMAWTGSNQAVREEGGALRLYRTTIQNPRPEAELTGVEIFSEPPSVVEPFIVAVTAHAAAP